MRKNELVVEEVVEEGRSSELVVVVAAAVALDQEVIHIDMEKNCMTGKNYSEKVVEQDLPLGMSQRCQFQDIEELRRDSTLI